MKRILSYVLVGLVVFSLIGMRTVRTGIQGTPSRFHGSYNIFHYYETRGGVVVSNRDRFNSTLRIERNRVFISGMTLTIQGTGNQLDNRWLLDNNVIYAEYYSENMEGYVFPSKNAQGIPFLLFMLYTPRGQSYMISCVDMTTGREYVYSAHKQ